MKTFGDNSRRESLQSTLADTSTLPTLPLARPQSKHTFLNESEVQFPEPAADRFIPLNTQWIGAAVAGTVNLNGAVPALPSPYVGWTCWPGSLVTPCTSANPDRPDKEAGRMIALGMLPQNA